MGEQWYMQIAGVDGGSVLKAFERWIEVDAYSWEIGIPTGGGRATGTRAGRVTFGNLVVTAPISVASPRIVEACVLQRIVPKVVLSGTSVGEDGMSDVFLSYELSNAMVLAVHHSDDLAVRPTERIELTYSTIRITYTAQDERGGPGQPVTTVHSRSNQN